MSPDDLQLDDDPSEPGAIGVGMGGSCPTCRAPIDLGQEFCLECGSPIRFTPRQRSRKRSRSAAPAAAAAPAKRSGFPWIPFLVVLALVAGGVALTLVDQGDKDSGSSSKSDSESTVPTITNTPPTTATESDTITTTLQDCDPAQPLSGTQPAVSTDTAGTTTDPTTGESIPSLDTSGTTSTGSTDPFGVPSTTPTDGSTTDGSQPTVTVDQNGNLCADTGTTDPSTTTPTTTTPTTPTTDTTSTTDTTQQDTSGTWPAGKDGWTVIVAGYDTQARADSRAAQVQGDGFSDSGVLLSTDFQSLCPGIYVVFSGTFPTESEANARLKELQAKPDYAGMYVREVKRSGTRPSNCTAAK